MKVTVEDLSPIEKKLSVEVPPERVKEELDRAYTSVGRQVKVPGFRPGKIPRRILEQRFRQQVEDDVIQRVVQLSYLEAISEHKVAAVGSPQITNGRLPAEGAFKYQARVEVRPVVEPKDYKGLVFKRETINVDDKAVEETVERLRKSATRREPVEGRDVAKTGDLATIDYTATADGKDFPGSKAEGVTVDVAQGELIAGKIAALEGVKVGDTKEVDYAFPQDYRQEDMRGKVAKFQITLKGLKHEVLPEVNDAFAKEVGAGETVAEMRQKIREDLERREKAAAETKEREELIKALVEKNPIEVPKAMVDRAIDAMLNGALQQMSQRGMDPRMLNFDWEKLREDFREKAQAEVKGTLLFDAIAEKEKLEVSDEEIEKRLEKAAEEEKVALSTLKKRFRDSREKEGLRLRIREEKTVEFLKSAAKNS